MRIPGAALRLACAIVLAAAGSSPLAQMASATHGAAGAQAGVRALRIDEPRRHWAAAGYVEMTPAVRISVAAGVGARTRIYLRIDEGSLIRTEFSAAGVARLVLPPGTVADRVSEVPYRDARGQGYTIDDVRGTRWDAAGREYFHVYRAAGAAAHAPLIGYEWPRGDARAEREATDLLAGLVATLALPGGGQAGRRSVRRFRGLNRCQDCHQADRVQAHTLHHGGPPWATDGSGLYTLLAVLGDSAPLSAEPFFHDPNATDPFVRAVCPRGAAQRLGQPGAYYFRCADDAAPIGVRELARGLHAGDGYSQQVCAARRYLHAHLDAGGRRHFAAAMHVCAIETRPPER